MGIELKRSGITDFLILEKSAAIGGVWRENTYPGAGCDVPSPLYSYSFEPRRTWPRRYSVQADILEYLRETADKYRITEHVQPNAEVVSAEFDELAGRWRVRTNTGETIEAEVLVPAVGQLSRPALPSITGMDTFTGHSFHSARWDHDTDLTGKRVAVIGTGASAVQFVPEIAPKVSGLTVFQRSAAYVLPKFDRVYQPWHHRMFRSAPATQEVGRFGLWSLGEFATLGLTGTAAIAALTRKLALRHLESQVSDPGLRAKLTPDYPVGCKRLLFSNDYLSTLARPDVDVVIESIDGFTERGVRTADGTEHEADVVIFGTGFATTEFLAPIRIAGLGGAELSEVWRDGAYAYLGMAVPRFPNMFVMYGPNTNLGAGSVIYMLESQARYIRQAVQRVAGRSGAYLDVRTDVTDRFDRAVQQRLERSVWTGCRNWYRTPSGRVTANWPGLVSEYRWRTRRLDIEDYRVGFAVDRTPVDAS